MTTNWRGRTAIVTGAGSGIGAATAELFANAGMNVVLVDIQEKPIVELKHRLRDAGLAAATCVVDVSDSSSVSQLAQFAKAQFGNVHLVFNNAGIAMHGVPMQNLAPDDWQWVQEVNVGSVIHSITHILPEMVAHGEEALFLTTASIGGLQVNPDWLTGAYSATKFAVVALSEALESELSSTSVRVAVLCPGAVKTNLPNSQSRPNRFNGSTHRPEQAFLSDALERNGVSPEFVARRLWRGILDREFYILTDARARGLIHERHRRIEVAIERAADFREDAQAELPLRLTDSI